MNAATGISREISSTEIPDWLSIARLDDRHYQITDVSVASIGFCLGIFPSREAAESIAAKIARSRRAQSPILQENPQVRTLANSLGSNLSNKPRAMGSRDRLSI